MDEFYEFKDSELLQKHFIGEINRIGELESNITIQLSECALLSEDITKRQDTIVTAAIEAYRSSSQ